MGSGLWAEHAGGVIWRRGVQEESSQGRSGSNFCWGDLASKEKWVSTRQLESEINPLGWACGRGKRRRLWKGRF